MKQIIQPGETYDIDGRPYLVVTAATGIGEVSGDAISLSRLLYILEDVQTGARIQISENELHAKIT